MTGISFIVQKNNLKNCGSVGLKIENELYFEKLKVTEHFNKFFTTIASTLVDHLPPRKGKYG